MLDLQSIWRSFAKLARHRLLQFAVLGGTLFALAPPRDDGRAVAISEARIEAMVRQEVLRDRSGKPAAQLRSDVVVRLIEDELLIREARRLGLDQEDHILRQRLVQKALFLAEDLGGASRAATEQELRQFYAAHRADYAEARLAYTHVFAHDRAELAALRDQVIAHARSHPGSEPPFGEPLPEARRAETTEAALQREWGEGFVAAVRRLPLGTWSEPLPSRRGFHLVLVERRTSEAPPFEEVRGRVELELMLGRRRQAVISFLENARRHYRIVVEGEPAPPLAWLGRTALRTSPSVED
jgi:hypothetical protein